MTNVREMRFPHISILIGTATWDTPPPRDSPFYPAFKRALQRYLDARLVNPPILTPKQIVDRERHAARVTAPPQEQPDCIVGGVRLSLLCPGAPLTSYSNSCLSKWKDLDGFRGSTSNENLASLPTTWAWVKRQQITSLAERLLSMISIQIAAFLGYLGSKELQIYPSLVVVPNSWVTPS